MSRNSIRVRAEPDAVFDVLDDACAYPGWVVGTRRVRRVDPSWPAVGSRFHHSVGTAAAELRDSSEVVARERPRRLVLDVRFRPTGTARVCIEVTAEGSGSVVVIEETPTSGPATWIPAVFVEPLLTARNALSLQRLRHEVERRDRGSH
jgi:polyketide cyclase/dehydrase/lipid transport protein